MPTVTPLALPGVLRVELAPIVDVRGAFVETYHRADLAERGIVADFVQDNESTSRLPGTVRGLHFQVEPHAQAKLVWVARGAIFDVVVDLRHGSPTFGRALSCELSAESAHRLFVPVGFAHGFCTLEPDTVVQYKVTAHHAPAHDRGLLWSDPALGIPWPVSPDRAILSDRDRAHPRLSELPPLFRWTP